MLLEEVNGNREREGIVIDQDTIHTIEWNGRRAHNYNPEVKCREMQVPSSENL